MLSGKVDIKIPSKQIKENEPNETNNNSYKKISNASYK